MDKPKVDNGLSQRPTIVFDAMCVLCSANAQFVLNNDRRGQFLLASMQGEVGSGLYRKFGIDPVAPDTIVVVTGEQTLRNSDAALSIYDGLGWPWRLLTLFRSIPRALRDPIYLLIARNRYRVFGKREVCWLPASEQAERAL